MEDYANTGQHLPIIQRQKHADTGVQYSATMNVRDMPSRMRTCLICIVISHEYDRKCDGSVFRDANPLQKELAVHVLDGIETEARAACGLTHCPSTDRRAG